MSNADLVIAVTYRLRDAHPDGKHPEQVEVDEELARMFIESQAIIAELRLELARVAPYAQVSP